MRFRPCLWVFCALILPLGASPSVLAQGQRPAAPVQKIGEGVYRVGRIEVDTRARELKAPAKLNADVTTLEFVANMRGGAKAYESALTIDADAVMFNTALLLLGLDPSHARVPTRHFDPVAPKGDAVDLFVEWTQPNGVQRIRIEQLLYDNRTHAPMPDGPWVYTGSAFVDGKYMAQIDGVLIGFVHSPSPMIENPRSGAVDAYGSIVLNTRLGIPPNAPLTLTVKARPTPRPVR